MNRAVFLDRDGVINKVILKEGKAYSPRSISAFEFVADIVDVVTQLKKAGYFLIVVTNQPDIARGKLPKSELDQMTSRINDELAIDEIFICPHDDGDNCNCRKPKPGMLMAAKKKYRLDLKRSFLIGDGWKDMGAARNAGCPSILIDTEYNQEATSDNRVKNIKEAAKLILKQ